ncbi:MAG: MFS transporter [Candidatus Poribacteria bacterium]|nr:MAG: MFS transporter [Candidatus Poribacteria bacterium]
MATTTAAERAGAGTVPPWRRWGVVLGALIIQLILGTVYSFSIFIVPFEQAFGWTRTQVSLTFSITLAVFALSMVLAGNIQDERGPRFTALLSALFLGVAFLAVSQMTSLVAIYLVHGLATAGIVVLLLMLLRMVAQDPSAPFWESLRFAVVVGVTVVSVLVAQRFITGGAENSLWMLYLTYGVLGGAGIGFGYVSPIAACVKWFPRQRGLITGVAVAGFGGGSMIFAPTASWTVEQVGWSVFFLIHGIVSAVGLTIGALLLQNPPPGYEEAQASPVRADTSPFETRRAEEYTWEEMLRTGRFWQLWVMFIFGGTAGLMTIGQLKPYGLLKGMTSTSASLAVTVLAATNALGRIAWGAISDRIGRNRAMFLMFGLQGAMMLLSGLDLFSGDAIFLVAAWVGFHFGGIFALFPSATADAFGTRGLGTNYGFVFTAYGVAAIVGNSVAARVYDLTGSYTSAFLFAGVLCLAASAIALLGGRRTPAYAR